MTDILNERRAIFVYDGARLAAIAANAPIIPEPWAERDDAFRLQFLEVIERQSGPWGVGGSCRPRGAANPSSAR